MPNLLTRSDRRLLASGGAAFVILVGAAIALGGQGTNSADNPSSFSTGSSGTKAFYLLLQASGYQASRWEQPPTDLTDASSTTLILAEPFAAPTRADREAVRRFLEAGGRVIATGLSGSQFLSAGARPDPMGSLTWKRVPAAAPSAITRAAPKITVSPGAIWNLDDFALPLYTNGDEPVVVHLPAGAGEAFWWASTTPMTNAGLREPGNLEFALASVGPPGGRRILFDEYFHGARRTLAASILQSPVKWLGAQLLLVVLVVLVTYSRRSGPVMAPAVESRLAPLEFVRTLGSLYERAGAASIAVDVGTQRFRFWLARRLGVAPDAPVDQLERAVRRQQSLDSAALAATLSACDAARRDGRLPGRAALSLVRDLNAHASALHLFAATGAPAPSPEEHR